MKGELVVLTPLKQEIGHYVVKIHREETAKSEKTLLIAGGQHTGIIINKLEKNATLDFQPDVSLSFSVSLGDKNQQQVQEKRSLYFNLRKNVEIETGKAVVHKFFRNLLSNLPSDYVQFMKRAMNLMQKEFEEIQTLVIDYKIVEVEEQVAIPDATQYDSTSEIEEVTAGHIQEVLEHAFPNGLPISTISEVLRCKEEEADEFLRELEKLGIARKVGDEWIRVDARKVDESIEAHKNAASTSSSTDQPTIAIISCLFVEKQAIDSLIKDSQTIHKYKSGGDSNVYTIGKIGEHKIVATKLALIGDSREAITSAGSITTRLLGNFQNIEHVFIVGVGGAVPHFTDASLHARLGDVIISSSRPHQYVYAHDVLVDRKTEIITGFAVRNWDASEKTIENIVLDGGEELRKKWNELTENAIDELAKHGNETDWKQPPESTDVLAMPVSKGNVVVMPHPNAETRQGPEIHLGTIGGMATIRRFAANETGGGESSQELDKIRESFAESFSIRCMDAGFDSVVGAIVGSCVKSWTLIRGIADYQHGQSRAAKVWQTHAAIRAASAAKCLIERLPPAN
ncbi:unnamed protein product [Caenorhabditis angaria]|uniref:Winged helix-turn-helix domain-containing protein n=1 Tax=Caenorhabditis angaria TaxID=860376 RepID=A0A9P1IHL4_9PELO|nr:unnamed protein product [Caenorhabditis angaria]